VFLSSLPLQRATRAAWTHLRPHENRDGLRISTRVAVITRTAPFASIVMAPASGARPPVSDATPFASNAAAPESMRIPRPAASGKPVAPVLEPLPHPETMAREKRETYTATLGGVGALYRWRFIFSSFRLVHSLFSGDHLICRLRRCQNFRRPRDAGGSAARIRSSGRATVLGLDLRLHE
jgi:hypothetical protein